MKLKIIGIMENWVSVLVGFKKGKYIVIYLIIIKNMIIFCCKLV